MARCGCASDQCSCKIIEGSNVSISGSGTENDPYVVNAATTVVDESGTPTPVGADSHFVGEIIAWAGSTAPSDDYLACDGAELNRAAYSACFAVTGTVYGAGNGSTTFNLPNLNAGRFPMGAGGGHARGATGGAETATLTEANLPPHDHSINHDHPLTDSAGLHDHNLSRSDSPGGNHGNIPDGQAATAASTRAAIADDGAHQHEIPAYTGQSGMGDGTSTPVSVLPPYVAINYYIRVQES